MKLQKNYTKQTQRYILQKGGENPEMEIKEYKENLSMLMRCLLLLKRLKLKFNKRKNLFKLQDKINITFKITCKFQYRFKRKKFYQVKSNNNRQQIARPSSKKRSISYRYGKQRVNQYPQTEFVIDQKRPFELELKKQELRKRAELLKKIKQDTLKCIDEINIIQYHVYYSSFNC
ncbi:unnamed protein product (macronuclear) [Paramecium tetraurelia]|uniref:Uncharacterized protein n=1 Tax=Paramecium tetraurelia TaxID=5888 RepID=A0CVV7_PARTE|nr:uncharacterized protein GSPATT00001126001 [Paramecium tetraurelia]CAK74924.1 unnamed protein product [Paramecium tetraurelia]|eukprot:XP_001442321.1 hypothetical protein (macronuclear) [Paramecium tetraurelia strain d4-2]